MAILGYARVSTHGQVLDIQELQLRAEGCIKIYAEKESGINAKRPVLNRLLREVPRGSVKIPRVWSLETPPLDNRGQRR